MEDGKKPDRVIPKIPQRDIMQNDVDRTIGLRDSEMMKLAATILAKEVSIKGNKLPGAQQREVPNPKADEDRSERAHGRVQGEGPPLKEEGVRCI